MHSVSSSLHVASRSLQSLDLADGIGSIEDISLVVGLSLLTCFGTALWIWLLCRGGEEKEEESQVPQVPGFESLERPLRRNTAIEFDLKPVQAIEQTTRDPEQSSENPECSTHSI